MNRLYRIARMLKELLVLRISIVRSRYRHVTYVIMSSWYGYSLRYLMPSADTRQTIGMCIHGRRYTEYDCDCLYCEEGYSWNDYAYLIETNAKIFNRMCRNREIALWLVRVLPNAPYLFRWLKTFAFNLFYKVRY